MVEVEELMGVCCRSRGWVVQYEDGVWARIVSLVVIEEEGLVKSPQSGARLRTFRGKAASHVQ